MPNLKKHCKNSEDRTGKDFEDLHIWMDEPGKTLNEDHRRVRHDLSYIPTIKELFGEKYGSDAIREFLKHIAEDYLDTVQ